MRVGDDSLCSLPSGGVVHAGGSAGGTPLLFLHGVGGGAWSWRPQRDALARDHRTFVWEARGHGAAARIADAGLSDYYTDAREALAATVAQTGQPAIVVAHSMGGLLAFALARDDAPSVAGLFLVDPVYATGDEYGHFGERAGAIARVLCAPLLYSFAHNGRVSRAIARWVFARAFRDPVRMNEAWRDQRTQIPFEYPRMLDESFGRPTGFELSDFAAAVHVPVELIEGTPMVGRMRFPQLVAALHASLGTAFAHEVIDGGHYLQLDRPAEVNARLAAFVARVDAARLDAG